MVESTAIEAIQLRVATTEYLAEHDMLWPSSGDRDEHYIGGGGNPYNYQYAYVGNNDACVPGADGSFNTMAVSWMGWDSIPSPFQIGVDGSWVGEHPDNQ